VLEDRRGDRVEGDEIGDDLLLVGGLFLDDIGVDDAFLGEQEVFDLGGGELRPDHEASKGLAGGYLR